MPAIDDQARSIFLSALEKRPEDWPAFLNAACSGDANLRARVDQLLRAHENLGSIHSGAAAVTTDQPPSEGPGTIIGPYKLIEEIGEGGMGAVYLAQQTEPVKRLVALKVIKAGMDSRQVIARFEAERQALALMDHPNIAKVLDGGTTPAGRPYFVMELVKGVPITKFCDERKLTPRQRLELFLPVCHAIQHAHQKGIIHRDIKPTNVLIALYDGQPVPKVIDFGVAKATGQPLTERTLVTGLGAVVGTPEYMSPEQAELNQLDIDTRSDVYSLGVLLYELLTGTTPLTRKRLMEAALLEVLRVIREEEPQRPSTRLSTTEELPSIAASRGTEPARLSRLVRGELDWVVMKALEKDRNRRYETANGFAMDVQRYLAGEAVQAVPPSARYRLKKFARRNRIGLVVSALVLCFLVLLGSGVGWAVRDRAARQAMLVREVNLALTEMEQWQAREKWPEALSAVKRAEGLLTAGGNEEIRERVRQFRRDLEMVLQVEEIALQMADSKPERWEFEKANRAFARAFADYGLDILGLPVEEAAARIRGRRGIAVALATALDDWAYARIRNKDRAGAMLLMDISQATDQDVWRRQVREAQKQNNGEKLAQLAMPAELRRQPPISIRLLTRSLNVHDRDAAAIEVLRQAQRQYPGDFWINFDLGCYLRGMHSRSPASHEPISFLRAALALRPNSPSCHYEVGASLLDLENKPDEAVESFRRAVELDPTSVYSINGLGAALLGQGKLDEAVNWFRKSIDLDPAYAEARYNLGVALHGQRKFDDAIASYRKAIELNPIHGKAHCNLGILLVRQGEGESAVGHLEKSIDLSPNMATAYFSLGDAYRSLLKWDEASAWYRKGVAINPKDADRACGRTSGPIDKIYARAYQCLGRILDVQNKLDEAIASYRKAIELDAKRADPHVDLGKILTRQNKLDEALACFQKGIECNPKNAEAHSSIGYIFDKQDRLDEAIAWYRKATELDPKDAYAQRNLGDALCKQAWRLTSDPDPMRRDLKRAGEYVVEGAELATESYFALQCAGWTQYRLGNWRASIEVLEKSCQLQPGGTGDAGQWIVLALAHARLAAREELPDKAREHHKREARSRYQEANRGIERWWRLRPGHALGQNIWDFREEARALMSVQESKK